MSLSAACICVSREAGWWLLRLTKLLEVGEGHPRQRAKQNPSMVFWDLRITRINLELMTFPWTTRSKRGAQRNVLAKIYPTSKTAQARGKSEPANGLLSWEPVNLSSRNQLPITRKSTGQWCGQWWLHRQKFTLLTGPEAQLSRQTTTSSDFQGHQWMNSKDRKQRPY